MLSGGGILVLFGTGIMRIGEVSTHWARTEHRRWADQLAPPPDPAEDTRTAGRGPSRD